MLKQELIEYRDELRGQVESITLERECAALRTMIEGTINADDPFLTTADIARETGWGENPGSVSMPSDRIRGAYWPFFRTELELAAIRAIGRRIGEADAMGTAVKSNLINYTVGTGFSYEVQECKRGTVLPGDIAAVQAALDAFVDVNKIRGLRERKLMEEALPAGEALVVLKDGPDHVPRVRIRSTDHLIQPVRPSDIEDHYGAEYGLEAGLDWSFGVATPPDDAEDVRGYCVAWYGVLDNWEFLPTDRCVHVKLNVPDDVKRGLSEFYADYREILRAGKGFMTASEQAILQATIAWIEKIDKGVAKEAVESAVATPATFMGNVRGPSSTRPVRFEQFSSGRVIRTDHDFAYGPMGDPKGFELIQVFQAVARRVGARRSMPEWMISGDASNNNQSSSITAGSAFDVKMQCSQAEWGSVWEEVCWKALAIMGFDTKTLKRVLRIAVTGRQIASRDEAVDENIREIRFRNGILSAKTWAAEADLDLDEELANGAKKEQPQASANPFSSFGVPRMEQTEARTQAIALRAIDTLMERQSLREAEEADGKWVTLDNDVRVKIGDGETLDDAISKLDGKKPAKGSAGAQPPAAQAKSTAGVGQRIAAANTRAAAIQAKADELSDLDISDADVIDSPSKSDSTTPKKTGLSKPSKSGKLIRDMTPDEYIQEISGGEKVEYRFEKTLRQTYLGSKPVTQFTGRDGKQYEIRKEEGGFHLFAANDLKRAGETKRGQVKSIGYIKSEGKSTFLAVSEMYRGKGLGEELQFQYRLQKPWAKSGGFSEAGERTARKVFARLQAVSRSIKESVGADGHSGWYEDDGQERTLYVSDEDN